MASKWGSEKPQCIQQPMAPADLGLIPLMPLTWGLGSELLPLHQLLPQAQLPLTLR